MKRISLTAIPPVWSVVLAVLSVQAGAAIAKGLFPAVGPAGAAGLRIGLSALMLMVVFRPPVGTLTRRQWQAVVPYGVALGAMNLLFYLALARIPLGLAVTLEFIGPLVLAVAGSRRVLDFVWVLLAASGIILIAPWTPQGVDLLGAVYALLAGASWAAYIVLGGRVATVLPGSGAVAIGMVFASLTVLPFTMASGGLHHLTVPLFFGGLALAVLSSALPFTLEMNALGRLSARTFSVLMSLEPAVAALCGLLFLGEHLGWVEWLSVVLVMVASIGATVTAPKRPPLIEV
ncbi:EamA family transporter [Hymenobacter glacialis]|uniref:Transporter n=1 Tax=Hymenobacter glacialis TaxID=1908236 RepID=A0A1G1T7V9_9BACT|nr:DMT family transporter [Hymenobacter glacialis]OGX86971.1 transporter [Hymenobacter glacialis]